MTTVFLLKNVNVRIDLLSRLVHVDALLANVELRLLRIVHMLELEQRRVLALIAQRALVAGEGAAHVRSAEG